MKVTMFHFMPYRDLPESFPGTSHRPGLMRRGGNMATPTRSPTFTTGRSTN